MPLLLGQLVYTSFAQVGYRTVVSANVPQEIQQAFIQQVVYQHWDAFNPPSVEYRAVYLYQVTPKQTLFGWLYNDGLDDLGRSHVPYFICYYCCQVLQASQLENIFTCLEKGPVALIARQIPTTVQTLTFPDIWSYQPARLGVEIPLDIRDRSYVVLQQRRLLELFVPTHEQGTRVEFTTQSYKQQKEKRFVQKLQLQPLISDHTSNNLQRIKQIMKFNHEDQVPIKNSINHSQEVIKITDNAAQVTPNSLPSQNTQKLLTTKIALLIGVSDYGFGFNLLPKAQKDVEAMQKILQHPDVGSFDEVRILINPNRQIMEEAIETLFLECQENDLILLYFSGHGIKDANDKLYLATSITRKDTKDKLVKSSAVIASFLQEVMNESRSKSQVLILDCCFTNTSVDNHSIDIAEQIGGEGRVILTSSSSTQCFFEQNESELSVYTHYLVEGMETGVADLDKDGVISVKELHDYTSKQVQKAIPAMQPAIYGIENNQQLMLAKAAVNELRRSYFEKAEYCANRGNISIFINRSILNVVRDHLGLSPEEAAAIEGRVLKPYRQYHKRLQRYVQEFVEAIYSESPLSSATRKRLRHLQLMLGLRDGDVAPIETEIAQQIKAIESLSQSGRTSEFKVVDREQSTLDKELSKQITIKRNSDLSSDIYPEQNLKNDLTTSDHASSATIRKKPWMLIGLSIAAGILTLAGAVYGFAQWQDSQKLKRIKALIQARNYEECIALATTITQSSISYNNTQMLLKQCEAGVNWKNIQTQSLRGHLDTVWSVAFNLDGQTLASGSSDNTIKIWNLGSKEAPQTLSGHSDTVWSVAFNPSGQALASGSSDNTIKIWNLGSKEAPQTLSGHTGAVRTVTFQWDGQTLASGSSDNTIKIWNLNSGKLLRTLSGHTGAVRTIALSWDGQTLVSGSSDNTIKIWNLESSELLRTLSGHSDRIISVALSPDGQLLASSSADKTIKIWNLSSGKLLHTLSDFPSEVSSVAISPDGRTLAAGVNRMLEIWNLNTLKRLHTLSAHSSNITSVAFSTNGKKLASGSQDNTIKVTLR